ncbi:zinc finger protein 862-like [Lissotriton helveticus]
MFKRKAVTSGECSASTQRKKCCLVFKEEWMKEIVEAETQKSRSKVRMQLGELFQYSPDVGLICKACAEAKIVGDFSTGKKWSDGWKLDYMKRHLLSKVHESAMVILRNRSAAARFGFGVRAMLTETATDKANRMEVVERQRSMPEEIKILINNVLLAVKMNTSMLSVQDIHDHLALYVKIPDSWRSKNYAFEFLEAINSVIHCEAMTELRQALYHTLIIDESTDISVSKMLILYFKFRPVTSTEHKTQFGGIVKLTSCNAEAITTAVKEFYTANELDLMKMVMFTSDGASVMLGKNNGVATRLKQSIPHLVEQHCVAHREDLGVDDAWKRVPMIKEMETLLRTVYTVFSRSPARKSKLDEIASVTECEVVSFRPLNEVRWLSRHFAVGALIRNYETVLKYFEHEKVEENDPIAKYCYKKLSDSNYHISLAVLNDILGEFAALCKLFQKSSLTTVEAVQYARAKIGQIKQQYLGDTVFWSSNVRELMVLYKDRQEFDSGPILSFVSLLCEHMQKRFPEGELKEWASFEIQAIATQAHFDFGTENIERLVEKYKNVLCLGDCETPEDVVRQYRDYKYVVAEHVKGGLFTTFQDMVTFTVRNAAQYSVVSQLVDVCATFQASSADCERGFSLMNTIKSKLRNRLEQKHLDMLMRTKAYLLNGKVDLDRVYQHWKNGKDRREKQPCHPSSDAT